MSTPIPIAAFASARRPWAPSPPLLAALATIVLVARFSIAQETPGHDLASLERSFWLDASLGQLAQKGYWGSDFPACSPPSEAEVEHAIAELIGRYAANRLYLIYHHETSIEEAEQTLGLWRRHCPPNVRLVPTLLLRMYDKQQSEVFTPEEIDRFVAFSKREIDSETYAVYDIYPNRDQGAALPRLARQFPRGLVRVGIQPGEELRPPFVRGVQDTWSGLCHGKTNADWRDHGFGCDTLRQWVCDRNREQGLIVWDLIAVAWDYSVTPRGAYPGYDNASKNMPLPQGRNILAYKDILRTARAGHLGGFSSDLLILQANSQNLAHDGRAGSLYETLRRGEMYKGYYAKPLQEIGAIYNYLKDGKEPAPQLKQGSD